MPLDEGKGKAAASRNISTLEHEGYPPKQAIAISLKKAGLSKYDEKRSKRKSRRK